MIVVTQIPPTTLDTSSEDEAISARIAREVGATLIHIPYENDADQLFEPAMRRVAVQPRERIAIWKGVIPSFDYYRRVHAELLKKRFG